MARLNQCATANAAPLGSRAVRIMGGDSFGHRSFPAAVARFDR